MYPTTKRSRLVLLRWIVATGLAIVSMWLICSALRTPHGATAKSALPEQTSEPGTSFLFRFDTIAQTFLTIPLPLGSTPLGIAVTGTNPTHVWVAEYGLNQIGHVVFTDTAHYELIEYAITSTINSGPYRVAVDRDYVWFTERGANRIGRLDTATGQIDEFFGHGLSPNAGLTDIKVAPDGAVWIGGQVSQRLVRLVVNTPTDYSFDEYTDTIRPGFIVAPSLLAVEDSNSVWLTVPESAHKVAQFTVATKNFIWPTTSSGSTPAGIAVTSGNAWFTDICCDKIRQIVVGTFTIVNSYGPITHPMELATESANVLWITQMSGQGAIARFIYTNTVSTQIDTFVLPSASSQPTGIAVASGSGIWVATYIPRRVYIPVVLKNN